MITAVYPGSFDPATYGHLDIIKRASISFDRVIVGVLHNSAKSPLFSVEERVKILAKATKDIPNVEVKAFEGLSVNFARENHAQPCSCTGCGYRFSHNQSGICILKLHDHERGCEFRRRSE